MCDPVTAILGGGALLGGVGSIVGATRSSPKIPDPISPMQGNSFGGLVDRINNSQVTKTTKDSYGYNTDGVRIPVKEEFFERTDLKKDNVLDALVDYSKKQMADLSKQIYDLAQRGGPNLVVPFQGFINEMSRLNGEAWADLGIASNKEDVAQFKDNWKALQRDTFNQEFDEQSHQVELELASRGLSSSTQADSIRAKMMNQKARGLSAISQEAEVFGRSMEHENLMRNLSEYDRKQQLRGQDANIAQQKFDLNKANVLAEYGQYTDNISRLSSLLNISRDIYGQDQNIKAQNNLLPTALSQNNASQGNALAAIQTANQGSFNNYQARLADRTRQDQAWANAGKGIMDSAFGFAKYSGLNQLSNSTSPLAYSPMLHLRYLGGGI